MIGLDTDGRAIVERVVAAQRRDGLVILASNDPRDFVDPEQVVELGRNGKWQRLRRGPVSRLPPSPVIR